MRIIKDYIAYLKDNPKGYWFKAKWFGWGWTPATKEGWFVTLVYIGLVLNVVGAVEKRYYTPDDLVLPIGFLTAIFITICYWKGEKPYWRWGKPKKH